MIYLILGVFLYGLTHPVGALFLQQNQSPLLFSALYIGTRTVLQLPHNFIRPQRLKLNRSQLPLVLSAGLIGAFLHWSEFQALTTGIPISQITFITYCFPVWIFIAESLLARKVDASGLTRFILAVLGLYLMIPVNIDLSFFESTYLYPIGTSFLLAMWIFNSKMAQEKGIHPVAFSFYYDLTSFIGLILIIAFSPEHHLVDMLSFTENNFSLGLIAFSVMVGILPNILTFTGIARVPPLSASLVMMFEPVVASLISAVMYKEKFGMMFILGAALVLSANIPEQLVKRVFKRNKKGAQRPL